MAPGRVSRTADEDDLVMTIYDDADVSDEDNEVLEDEVVIPEPQGKKRKRDAAEKPRKKQKGSVVEEEPEVEEGENDGTMDPDFEFQLDDGITELEDFDGWASGKPSSRSGGKEAVNIDEIIARRRQKDGKKDDKELEEAAEVISDEELLADDAFGMGAEPGDEDSDAEEGSEDGDSAGTGSDAEEEESDEEVAKPVPHPDDIEADESSDEETEDPAEMERQNAFFAPESDTKPVNKDSDRSFMKLSLSRPILKGLFAAGFTEPTPIQRSAIPVALLGKDVVGSAVTGSGKTGAFIIPILERLLYRSKKTAATRVAILMPTRELALQCYSVATKLASFTDITFGQAIGGLNSREQENALKLRPDIVIATPGRFIDFMRNSASFAVDTIEIMVLDEADRMLEDGFADELNEILTTLPKSRQTMLFSATMTSSIDNLIRVGLHQPVRLMVDAKRQTVAGLTQEFVRLRPGREGKRLGCLLYICSTAYHTRTIIFFRQKKEAHRVRIVFGLLGLKAAELHGSMSQEQRINAIEAFRSGNASYLLATDLASRGLDIKNIETVINYEAPQSHEIYLHRVGRTARAGRTGRSCTIAADADRKVVKAAVKAARAQGAIIKSRTIAPSDADTWQDKADGMEDDIEAVMREEKEEKVMATTEMQMRRADNIMAHEAEIKARPKKTWFESTKEKAAAKEKGREQLNGPAQLGGGAEKKKGKLSNKQKKKLDSKDERTEGRLWKKGKAERGAKPADSKGAPQKKNVKGGKPGGKPGGKSGGRPGGKGKGRK